MRKSSTNPKVELAETINFILQNLPDPKDNSVSTIKDELLVNDKKVIYLAQKSKGAQGFYWNISLN
ncbi:hypothetical protein ACFSJU_13365 [Paradesertivirga mongoliensis]|uniref:Uncharacterized protein n=1 Tax=Paradesertivirga mongoliensis TaxID=2100740 RepID=A0ABW4ZNV5_9SPHI|nr:hypothetical protein [Pedobacter mongoliensis]